MSRSVTIASGKSNVLLPNGTLYQAGDTVTLTDAEFAQISASLIPSYVVDNGPVADVGDEVVVQGAAVTLTGAAAAGATPTKAEFDAVVDDVTALHTSLTGTGKALASA